MLQGTDICDTWLCDLHCNGRGGSIEYLSSNSFWLWWNWITQENDVHDDVFKSAFVQSLQKWRNQIWDKEKFEKIYVQIVF